MILVEPPSKIRSALERRYRLKKGTDPASEIGLQLSIDALAGKASPARMEPLYFHAIESMERSPHIREIEGEKVVVHDEAFADTLNFLEITYIGEDRPLVPWTVLARTLCEFLYIDTLPGLGLYMADVVNGYVEEYAEPDGLYVRPVFLKGKYAPNTPVKKLKKELEALAERKRRHMELERAIILFHEIGHALYEMDPGWREVWRTLGLSGMNMFYRSLPIEMDTEYGMLRRNKMSAEEIKKLERKLVDKMVEEMSCDWFALAGILLNASSWKVSLEEAMRMHWRFMLFTDLIDQVRIQAHQRSQNKVQFRSQMTKLFVRTGSILSILGSPENIPRSKLVTEAYRIQEALESIEVSDLVDEFNEGLEVASKMMSWAIGGPAPWEWDLDYGKAPGGYLISDLGEGSTVEESIELFGELFSDEFLRELWEPEDTHCAPGCRTAGHLLCRSRIWANHFFANKEFQQEYAAMAEEEGEAEIWHRLRSTFEDVTRNKASIQYVYED